MLLELQENANILFGFRGCWEENTSLKTSDKGIQSWITFAIQPKISLIVIFSNNSIGQWEWQWFILIWFFPAAPITIELVGKQVRVSRDMAIFITMNPGYAGRSNLPDNLKKLFRSLAMTTPDRQLIAQVMLYSQGFRTAEKLATKIVPFFK